MIRNVENLPIEQLLGKDRSSKEIFYKIYQDYKDKLLLTIKRKDRIFEKIEQDLHKRYLNTMSHLKNSKNSDFNIECIVNVYEEEPYESYNLC